MVHVKVGFKGQRTRQLRGHKHRGNVGIAHERKTQGFYAVIDVHSISNGIHYGLIARVEWVEVAPSWVEQFSRPGIPANLILCASVGCQTRDGITIMFAYSCQEAIKTYQAMELMENLDVCSVCRVVRIATLDGNVLASMGLVEGGQSCLVYTNAEILSRPQSAKMPVVARDENTYDSRACPRLLHAPM